MSNTLTVPASILAAVVIVPMPGAKPLLPAILADHLRLGSLPRAERNAEHTRLSGDAEQTAVRSALDAVWRSPDLGLLFDAAARRYCRGLDPDAVSEAVALVWQHPENKRGDVFPFARIRAAARRGTTDPRPAGVPMADDVQAAVRDEHRDPRSVDELIRFLADAGERTLARAVRKRTMPRDSRPYSRGLVFPWTLTTAERVALHRKGGMVRAFFDAPQPVAASGEVVAGAMARALGGRSV